MKIGHDYIGVATPFYCTDGHGKFLLHKRSKNCRDEHGAWDTGSGQLEFGSTLEENVLREVREEYGCDGEILEQLPPRSVLRTNDGQPTHWVACPFVITVDPAKVRNNEPHKIENLGWFSLDALPEPLHTGLSQTLKSLGSRLDKYN